MFLHYQLKYWAWGDCLLLELSSVVCQCLHPAQSLYDTLLVEGGGNYPLLTPMGSKGVIFGLVCGLLFWYHN